MQVGDFRVSREPPTVPLMQILCNLVFLKSQNLRNAGTIGTIKKIVVLESKVLPYINDKVACC